ncbi:hypothetical protein ABT354_30970 [Streptomyces sp. NPDC000594]|uniref:helix-turn-helix domain-containing protein n=1 Tax=Streptomyces sp. NPDC000594 TaxID=3154261 RepID=UPI00331A9E01
MGEAPTGRGTIADRLTWLIRTRHPNGTGPSTYDDIAQRSRELAVGAEKGISHQTVLNIASGAVTNPGINSVKALARVFQVSVGYLLGETDSLSAEPSPGAVGRPAPETVPANPADPTVPADPAVPVERLARRLDRLFTSVVPAGRAPYSEEEVAGALAREGHRITADEIAALRNGEATTAPSGDLLAALAGFFMMPVAYFEDAAAGRVSEEDLKVLEALRSVGAREIAMRAMADLDEEACQALVPMIEHLSQAGRRRRM